MDQATALFVHPDGSPQEFYIPPCHSQKRISGLIKAWGGLVKKGFNTKAIILADASERKPNLQSGQPVYSIKYVEDSIAQRAKQPLRNYVISGKHPASPFAKAVVVVPSPKKSQVAASTPSKPMSPAKPTTSTPQNSVVTSPKKPAATKTKYTESEDEAIIEYVNEEAKSPGSVGSATGNNIWKRMETEKVTSHSWQSMKDHYLKTLKPKLDAQEAARHTFTERHQNDEEDDADVSREIEYEDSPPSQSLASPPSSQQASQSQSSQSKKRQLSEIYEETRQKKVKLLVDTLASTCRVHTNVVLHALISFSGNVNAAREYLKNSKATAWLPEEDRVLMMPEPVSPYKESFEKLVTARGRAQTAQRIQWLG